MLAVFNNIPHLTSSILGGMDRTEMRITEWNYIYPVRPRIFDCSLNYLDNSPLVWITRILPHKPQLAQTIYNVYSHFIVSRMFNTPCYMSV